MNKFTFKILIVLHSAFLFQGCGILFGTSQKVDHKSNEYSIYRFDHETNNQWQKINTSTVFLKDKSDLTASEQEPDQADLAFENQTTGAIISMNSVCHPQREASLEDLSRNLLMGLKDSKILETKTISIDSVPAINSELQTTTETGSIILIRAIVLRKSGCTYDFMHIAKQDLFDSTTADFDKFMKGFHAP